jgi:hypothetical protein
MRRRALPGQAGSVLKASWTLVGFTSKSLALPGHDDHDRVLSCVKINDIGRMAPMNGI